MANVLMTKYTRKPRKVKRKKAKPRIRKKKVLTKKQRARAAKKGWRTRRKREREILKKARQAKANEPVQIQIVEQVSAVMRHLIDHRQVLGHISAMNVEDQELAIEKLVRAYTTNAKFVEVDAEDEEILKIRTRLRLADEEGDLDEVMELIAEEYNLSPSEVYTQWLYCGVQ